MSRPSARSLHVICDWDGSLTQQDTLHLVAQAGYDRNNLPLDGDSDGYKPPLVPWRSLGETYMKAYERYLTTYRPPESDRTTLALERQWLASLKDVELAGVRAAEDSRVFKGVKLEDVQRTASDAVVRRQLQLRPGWDALLEDLLGKSEPATKANRFEILSVNWSRAFIRKAISTAWEGSKTRTRPQQGLSTAEVAGYLELHMPIHANEIHGLEATSGSDGNLRHGDDIRTSQDKLTHMPERCRKTVDRHEGLPPAEDAQLVVYIGDSDTDLECLLAADVGICVRDPTLSSAQKKLLAILNRLEIPCKPIGEMTTPFSLQEPRLWYAPDFHQIRQKLFL